MGGGIRIGSSRKLALRETPGTLEPVIGEKNLGEQT